MTPDRPEHLALVHADADGCCGDYSWRGQFCLYHKGMLAGLEVAASELPRPPTPTREEIARVMAHFWHKFSVPVCSSDVTETDLACADALIAAFPVLVVRPSTPQEPDREISSEEGS